MMDIMVPETCWASNKICNKYHLLHLVGILFPHIKGEIVPVPFVKTFRGSELKLDSFVTKVSDGVRCQTHASTSLPRKMNARYPFFEVCHLVPVSIVAETPCLSWINYWTRSFGGMKLTGEKWGTRRNTCPSATRSGPIIIIIIIIIIIHVHELLGVFPVPWSSKWSWSLHLFFGRPMFLLPSGLYCSACFGILFLSILCTCCIHFFWYCFISFTMFCAPVFTLIYWLLLLLFILIRM